MWLEYFERLVPVFDLDPDPDHHQIAFIRICGCGRSCAEDHSDEGTLLVSLLVAALASHHTVPTYKVSTSDLL